VLLGVAPAVPGALDGGIDELEPVGVVCVGRRRREGQQLPFAVVPDLGDDRLPRPAGVPQRSESAGWRP
jgi:hypothetical protein